MSGILSARGGVVLIALLAALAVAPPIHAAPSAQASSGFELTAAPVGNASAALRWTALPEAASYNVYGVQTVVIDPATTDPTSPEAQPTNHPLARATPGTWVEVAKDLRTAGATLTDLPRERTLAFVVRAVDASGREYAQSAPATVVLEGAPGDDLVVDMPTFTAARLSWEPVPGATRYAVLAAPAGQPLAPDRARQALTETTTVIDGLPPGGSWRFAVLAQDADGRVLAQTRLQEVVTAPPMGPMFGMR